MRNNNTFKLITIALLLQVIAVSSFAQKSIQLSYNLNEGDKYSYLMELDQDVVFETNGQTMALDMFMGFDMTQKVAKVTSDSIQLEGEISRIKMTQAIFGMEVKYDSDDPATAQNPMTAQMAAEFAKTLNKPFYMMMDHQGEVGDMDLNSVSGNDDIANSFNSGSQIAIYPKGKVKVGESWEREIKPASNSDMKFKVKYTLLKVSGKQATLGLDGVIVANEMEDVDIKVNGTMKGEMIVDAKSGWLIKSVIDQELEMDIEQNGMKFPATTSGTITTTSAKIN